VAPTLFRPYILPTGSNEVRTIPRKSEIPAPAPPLLFSPAPRKTPNLEFNSPVDGLQNGTGKLQVRLIRRKIAERTILWTLQVRNHIMVLTIRGARERRLQLADREHLTGVPTIDEHSPKSRRRND
jgi:hypothetical protein